MQKSVFATDKATWDIILVGTDYYGNVENRFVAGHRSEGLILGPEPKLGRPRVRVFARRWRDILDDNRAQLRLVTDSLEHDPSLEDGLRHIREQFADLLPSALQRGQEEAS